MSAGFLAFRLHVTLHVTDGCGAHNPFPCRDVHREDAIGKHKGTCDGSFSSGVAWNRAVCFDGSDSNSHALARGDSGDGGIARQSDRRAAHAWRKPADVHLRERAARVAS